MPAMCMSAVAVAGERVELHALKAASLEPLTGIVESEIQAGKFPGAVVLIGNRGKVIYRRAFGYRSLTPTRVPMTEDTVFDLASLTKVIATTTAVMQLVEAGKLDLDSPVAAYWPAFGANGKESITVKELLTHYSGLRPDLNLASQWSGYEAALRRIVAEKPSFTPGSGYLYSDINFEILGELVQRISGLPLDLYCAQYIFQPLAMLDTEFTPPPALRDRMAPTEEARGRMRLGEVHDPTASRMGGVAGHAGLFSTADDLAIFAQMLLNEGSVNGVQILSPQTVEMISTVQTPSQQPRRRGLGWDLEGPFASNRNELPSVGSYGHTGFTGTSIWIDPITRTYVILLTNRVYPNGKGDVAPLRKEISSLVSQALGPVSTGEVLAREGSLGVHNDLANFRDKDSRNAGVASGIDVLVDEQFVPLAGMRVGLITNHTGLDSKGRRTIDLFNEATEVKLEAIFSPEHGLLGNLNKSIASGTEPAIGLPVFSLYGEVRRPTDVMLKNLDALVFDVQDAGVRFYTYITTMAYAMEAAAQRKIPFYVLDRPNPIGGSLVQGPVMDQNLKSFTGYFPMPVRHGMTVGELAEMFNAENKIGAELHVIKMRGYRRNDWYDDTGLRWIAPSPIQEAALYPGVGMIEGANVSVGRGTSTPFEVLGAPWIRGKELADYLNLRWIAGVNFTAVEFQPNEDRFKNQVCHGIRINLLNRQELDAGALGTEIASALYRLYPRDFQLAKTLGLIGARRVLGSIQKGQDPQSIVSEWQSPLDEFRRLRARYLLYE